MTIYTVQFCYCGWQSEVYEDTACKQITCKLCKRELSRASAVERQFLLDMKKPTPLVQDGPSS